MSENIVIKAISFLYKGERLLVEATPMGRFKVPVSEVINGTLRTVKKNLTAKEAIEHDIIKSCDPTMYLADGRKLRVYLGGDPTYLPAEPGGLADKHDEQCKPKPKPKKNKPPKIGKLLDKPVDMSYDEYMQTGMWDYYDDDDYNG
tara:strand:- start:82 stop:519 length:438 start_codon:yes stop_codon:yes gene_type:complete